jgi:DNA-binding PucR family transcriptional regulator
VVTATTSATLEKDVEDALRAAIDAVERDAAHIYQETAEVLAREVKEVLDDDRTRADVYRRGRAQIKLLVRELRRGAPPDRPELASETRDYARLLARRGVSLDVFLRIHRLSFGVLLRAFEERLDATASAEVVLAATRRLTELLFAQHDRTLEELSAEYQREREQFVRSADALRRETVKSILAEEPVDLDRAAAVLRHDLRRHHIGLVLWGRASPDEAAVAPRLERAAVDAAEYFQAGRPLLLAESTGTVWGWLAVDAEPPPDLLDAFVQRVSDDRVWIAIGEPARGVGGFRQTHRDAVDAARVAKLGRRRPGSVIAYRAVELPALLSADIGRAKRFVARQLGPLAVDDDKTARLRATLRFYLEENGSRATTARRLGIHPNTVGLRMRACQELLGRDLHHRQVRLQVALGLAASLGPAVLRERGDEPHPSEP